MKYYKNLHTNHIATELELKQMTKFYGYSLSEVVKEDMESGEIEEVKNITIEDLLKDDKWAAAIMLYREQNSCTYLTAKHMVTQIKEQLELKQFNPVRK